MKRIATRTPKGVTAGKTSTRPQVRVFVRSGKAEGSSALRHLLGGKGCELAEMTNLGVPVPPGFTITTAAWAAYHAAGGKHPPGLWPRCWPISPGSRAWPAERLGDPERPLLVSVRSGARASMPGMMDTVLNLGLNDQTVEGLSRWTRNERFAWDCYRRFLTIFGDVVLGIERRAFDELLDRAQGEVGAKTDADVPAPRAARAGGGLQAPGAGADGRAVPAGRRWSSSASPSTPYSTRGSPRRPWTTGASIGCPTTGARR